MKNILHEKLILLKHSEKHMICLISHFHVLPYLKRLFLFKQLTKKLSFVYPYQPYDMVYVSVRLFLIFAMASSLKANSLSPSLPQSCVRR